MSESFYIYFTITGKNIACCTEDFVMQKFLKSRFHCIAQEAILYRSGHFYRDCLDYDKN